MDYKVHKGKFGKVAYIEMMRKWVLRVAGEAYEMANGNWDMFYEKWEGEFTSRQDLDEYVKKNSIKIVIEITVEDPLRRGLPDCRCLPNPVLENI